MCVCVFVLCVKNTYIFTHTYFLYEVLTWGFVGTSWSWNKYIFFWERRRIKNPWRHLWNRSGGVFWLASWLAIMLYTTRTMQYNLSYCCFVCAICVCILVCQVVSTQQFKIRDFFTSFFCWYFSYVLPKPLHFYFFYPQMPRTCVFSFVFFFSSPRKHKSIA